MNKLLKLLVWVVGGLTLAVGYWYWYMLGFSNAQEVYIVPHDFRGVVYVLFEQRDGVPAMREGRDRVYRIPSSGLLRTQAAMQKGMMRLPEFYWDSAGQRRPLRYQLPNGRRTPLGAYVSRLEYGSGGCAADEEGNPKEQVSYESFIVSDEQNVERFYNNLRDHEYTPPELICEVTLTDEDSVKSF